MKKFSIFGWLPQTARPVASVDERLVWLRDPLSHPAIEAMAERERADLPFDRGRVAPPRTACHCV